METLFCTAFGDFQLNRFPLRKNDTLRAWDAADELVLTHLFEQYSSSLTNAKKTLIINDQFGAISIALHAYKPQTLNDSYIAEQALQLNARNNSLPATPFISSTEDLAGCYDLVIIKVQKSLAQLEEQLHKIRPHIHQNTKIIGCSMVKMLHNSTLNLFTNIIGPTTTSLARKKARLIFSQVDTSLNVAQNPYPQTFALPEHKWEIANHANVFSRAKLDIGCRFFIDHLPSSPQYQHIIDLGCGNGIVGMVAAKLNKEAQVDFYDESYMAVASAKMNFQRYFPDHKQGVFQVDDCLSSRADNSADLILNNPPFHQQNAIGDFIAWQMFKQAYKVLVNNGELWVVGNRHLQYQQKLKKIFNNCEQVTSNNKFVILRAIKSA